MKCQCEYCDLRDLFFGHVSADVMTDVCSTKIEQSFEKGEQIVRQGERVRYFRYLKEGLVKLFVTDNQDKSQIITIGKPFDFVSLLSVFSDRNHKYSVSALDTSVTCSIEIEKILDLANGNGPFAVNVMQKMSQISDNVILNSLEIRKKHLRGRTAHVLLFFADEIFKSDKFELPISRKEIAEYIGMTPENVIRTLSEFRKDKLIHINGKLIEILDKPKLNLISEHG